MKHVKQCGNNSLRDFETVLMQLLERYNLFVDGQLNKETLELMNKPRYVEKEKRFRVVSKWNNVIA